MRPAPRRPGRPRGPRRWWAPLPPGPRSAAFVAALPLALAAASLGGATPSSAGRAAAPAAPSPHGGTRQAELRILSYNIKHGLGMDDVIDLSRAARVIRSLDPDLVALQEIDSGAARSGGVDQALELGQMTGMASFFSQFMPYDGGRYGMALLLGLPFRQLTSHILPEGAEPRTSATARVQVDGVGEVVFAGVHFYRTEAERLAQAEHLLEVLEDETAPVIVAGDFNSTPGSAVMELFAGSFTIAAKEGAPETYRADAPEREIDFIAYRPPEAFEVVESRVVDEPLVSDHRPVLLVLRVVGAPRAGGDSRAGGAAGWRERPEDAVPVRRLLGAGELWPRRP